MRTSKVDGDVRIAHFEKVVTHEQSSIPPTEDLFRVTSFQAVPPQGVV
jgi:hypothetical protein